MSATPPPQAPHLVSLKVLRCVRPSLAKVPLQDTSSLIDKPGRALNDGMEGLLALPASFGTLYLGETFNAILSLSNDLALSTPSSSAISPTLKVEIHSSFSPQSSTPGTRQHLLTTSLPSDRSHQALNPGESFETLVGCELKELGIHALVATVSYGVRGEDGRDEVVQRNFRKIYKFQVNNPLSVRTKAHSPNASLLSSFSTRSSPLHLEIQITNQTIGSMHFSQLAFNPLPEWELVEAITPLSIDGTVVEDSLEPGDTRQFLFRLRKKPGSEEDEGVPGSNQALGRLDIAWTTPNGETGRLTTSLLGRKIPQNSTSSSQLSTGQFISVKTVSIKAKTVDSSASTSKVQLEEPFIITFRAHLTEGTLKNPTLYAQYLTNPRDTDSTAPPVVPPVEAVDVERIRTSSSTPRQSFDSRPVSPLPPPPPPPLPLASSESNTTKGFPPPFFSRPTSINSSSALLIGPSTVRLKPRSGEEARGDDYEFSFTFVPVSSGRIALGGLRLLLEEGEGTGEGSETTTEARRLSTVQEWISIGEVRIS